MDYSEPRTSSERISEILRSVVINLLFTALVVLVGYILVVTYQLKRLETRQKKHEVDVARAQLLRDVKKNEEFRHEVRFLRTAEGVETVAREKLGLILPGETSYVVVNAPSPPPSLLHQAPPTDELHPPQTAVTVRLWTVITDLWNGGD